MAATSPYLVAGSFAKVAPHHTSVKALWDIKWRKPCSMGIYPFVDGQVEDFDRVFDELIRQEITEPYDPDTFAAAFLPVAKELEEKGAEAETTGDLIKETAEPLRYIVSPASQLLAHRRRFEAWDLGTAAYIKASRYLDPVNTEVTIPHALADASVGDTNTIQAYLRLPQNASAKSKEPVIIFICGLDAYHTDHTNRTSEHVRRGFACLSIEILGTGDCPAAKGDPTSPDRLWSSVLDWIETQDKFDKRKVCVRSISTGGYYRMRIAHTHADRLVAIGMQDEIFPIEDSMIPLEHGNVKEARFVQNAYHMGNPAGEGYVYDWLDQFK